MYFRIPIATAVALCAASPAQITSPSGYLTTEGSASFAFFGTARRLMVIDATVPSGGYSSIAWRRDGALAANNSYAARTFDLAIRFGRASLTWLDARFDANYVRPSTVVFSGPVSFRGWASPPGTPPALFDLQVPIPLYNHSGNHFVWDVDLSNSTSAANVPMDRHGASPASAVGTVLGTGCTATGQGTPFAHTMRLMNGGTGMDPAGQVLRIAGTAATPNAPWGLLLAGVDPNDRFGVFCGNIRADFGTGAIPPFPVFLGVTSPTGQIFDLNLGAAAGTVPVGAMLYSQLFSLDPNIFPMSVALSNGCAAAMPAPTSGTAGVAYLWSNTPSVAGTVVYGGAPIARLW